MSNSLTDSEERHRIPTLDGVRGIAILSVMVFHFLWWPWQIGVRYGLQPSTVNIQLISFIFSGWVGVDLFFVLSGFLITRILLTTKNNGNYFRNFYLRRVLRIFPLYYLILVLLPWILSFFSSVSVERVDPNYKIWLWTYTSNILIARKGWLSVPDPIAHVWSLAIEEQFYLIWPLIVFFLNKKKLLIFCCAVILLCPLLRTYLVLNGHWTDAYLMTYCRLDELAIGGLLAWLHTSVKNKTALLNGTRYLGSVVFVGLVVLYWARTGLRGEDPPTTTIGLTLLALFFAFFINESLLAKWTKPVLSSSVLRFFGKYSYGLYLLHQPICLYLGMSGAIQKLASPSVQGNSFFLMLFYLGLPTLVSVFGAVVIWHLWELPFVRLKKKVASYQAN